MTDGPVQRSNLSALLLEGDATRTRAALGLTISHCTIVLQSNLQRQDAWDRQPYWEAAPWSDESLYHVDEVVHEELEYEEWVNQVWAAVFSMLSGAANLSKLFYGVGRVVTSTRDDDHAWVEAQRRRLREILDPGPALGAASRVTRDAFEHIDERLWWRLLEIHHGRAENQVIRYATGAKGDWNELVQDPPLGVYDPGSASVWFWQRDGQEVSTHLGTLADEAARLKERAIAVRLAIAPEPYDI